MQVVVHSQPQQDVPISGILNVNKPSGWTSHDVVARLRRLTGQRRIGHAGTLDPLAKGVLVVCLGSATRVVDELMQSTKVYEATIVFGVTTSTDDAEGTVIRSVPNCHISRDDVERELTHFIGRIWQVPPAYSAVKVGGRPLYAAARRGEEVARQPRPVDVYRIELLDWAPPRVCLRIACGKGTYIRSIARDLGERLGCGAHLGDLVRTASGPFTLDDALSLAEVEAAWQQNALRWLLWPVDRALLDLDAVVLSDDQARRMRHGGELRLAAKPGERRRAYTVDGTLIGILARIDDDRWKPVKVFQ